MCLSPITIKDKLYDDGKHYLKVPCGKCEECLNERRNMWAFRLSKEVISCSDSYFYTATYDNDNLPIITKDMLNNGVSFTDFCRLSSTDGCVELPRLGDFMNVSGRYAYKELGFPTLYMLDVTNFIKRLRTALVRKFNYTGKLKYFVCGEYGSHTKRPHYHFILMFDEPFVYDKYDFNLLKFKSWLDSLWKYGVNGDLSYIQKHTDAVGRYCTKYMLKNSNECAPWPCSLPPFQNMSQGLAKRYAIQNADLLRKRGRTGYVTDNDGHKQPIPRYIKNKIFSPMVGDISRVYSNEFPIFETRTLADGRTYHFNTGKTFRFPLNNNSTSLKKSIENYEKEIKNAWYSLKVSNRYSNYEEFRTAYIQGAL